MFYHCLSLFLPYFRHPVVDGSWRRVIVGCYYRGEKFVTYVWGELPILDKYASSLLFFILYYRGEKVTDSITPGCNLSAPFLTTIEWTLSVPFQPPAHSTLSRYYHFTFMFISITLSHPLHLLPKHSFQPKILTHFLLFIRLSPQHSLHTYTSDKCDPYCSATTAGKGLYFQ